MIGMNEWTPGRSVPILFEEFIILLVFECVQLVEIFILEPVLVRSTLRFEYSFLNHGFGIGCFLRDNAMFAQDIVPVCGVSS